MQMTEQVPGNQAPSSTIVGIDEAGYGPLLGPLVVTAAVFDMPVAIMRELPSAADGPDLWTLLSNSITKRLSRRDPRLAVADSKKLYNKRSGSGGIAPLERAVLSFMMQSSKMPTTMRSLLAIVCPQVIDQLRYYPWYSGGDVDLPVKCNSDDLATQRNALAADFAGTDIRFRGAWVEVLLEGHYNRLVGATQNKAVVLFGQTVRLVQRIADAAGPRPLRVWIDRQGGRIGYRRPLMSAFEDAQLEVLEETPQRSSYRLTRRPAPWMVRFVCNGESHHLPIALASIISKYIRELFMICFNRYWSGQVTGLKPTAGYYQDGQRFITDIQAAAERLGTDRQLLIRSL